MAHEWTNYIAKWQTDVIPRKKGWIISRRSCIMLTKKAKKSLMKWKPINERKMYARFYSSTLISLIVVYAPTNESAEEAMEAFMEQLQQTIKGIPKHDILPIIGDFNA